MLSPSQSIQYQKESVERALTCANCGQKLHVLEVHVTGMKPDDLIGAWACSDCHAEIDRRTHNLDNKDARLYHLEGVIRTQAILLKEGKIKP
ncbi:nuclease domain-containing protein [Escherichia coli]|nr:nuclease domain-containing protein [Escherichia coli]HAJ2793689.1 DUF1364 family protein [Escherichia coli]HAJ2855881.1 DUF1364 family protein [Escherichia coli]